MRTPKLGATMTSDLDVYRPAKVLIDKYGPGAWICAAQKHRELRAAGDQKGAAVWLSIAAAIAKLDDALVVQASTMTNTASVFITAPSFSIRAQTATMLEPVAFHPR